MPHEHGFEYRYGKAVKANVGGKVGIAFLTGPARDVPGADGAEQKYEVTSLDGNTQLMAYTSPQNDLGGGFFTTGK